MTEPQIVVEGLVKSFEVARRHAGLWGGLVGLVRRDVRIVRALDGVSFSIAKGELVGYIGPNGAGKSTTVKILSGSLVPEAGRVVVMGRTPWRERVAHVARIGVVFGQRTQLWWDLPVLESFELLRDVYSVPEAAFRRTLDELVALLDLEPLLHTSARQLSLGQRMRCDIVAALLHDPEILFLDEPTIGLDAVSKLAVRGFIRRLNEDRGVTVILTTHDMDDIEALCRRVLVIGGGRILVDGALADLRRGVTGERWLTLDLEGEESAAIDDLEAWGATLIERQGRRLRLAFDPEKLPVAELIARISARHALRDVFVENPPIETIIARLYAREHPEAPRS